MGGLFALLALAMLVMASPASAAATATVAPIGSSTSGNYLVTIVNGELEKVRTTVIALGGEEKATSVAPGDCVYGQPVAGPTIGCGPIEPGATLQLCYHGPAATSAQLFYESLKTIPVSTAATVATCPVSGFDPPSSGGSSDPSPGGESKAGGSAPTLGKVAYNRTTGTASLAVHVPGPGVLKLSGKGVKGRTVRTKKAGAVSLAVKASGAAATKLAANGRVTVHVTVTYTPAGGSAKTLKKILTLTKEH
jgi:hypothetical protein